MSTLWRFLGGLGVVAALLWIFQLYTHPDFMVGLAQQVWACF